MRRLSGRGSLGLSAENKSWQGDFAGSVFSLEVGSWTLDAGRWRAESLIRIQGPGRSGFHLVDLYDLSVSRDSTCI